MAKCDEGYFCAICGSDVADITHSDLYLRYVAGILNAELLHLTKERHIRCNPVLAQFIVDPEFDPMIVVGGFDKAQMDLPSRLAREALITRAWRRLFELKGILAQGEFPITEYPLPEVLQAQTNFDPAWTSNSPE